jgi:hypothetical protein
VRLNVTFGGDKPLRRAPAVRAGVKPLHWGLMPPVLSERTFPTKHARARATRPIEAHDARCTRERHRDTPVIIYSTGGTIHREEEQQDPGDLSLSLSLALALSLAHLIGGTVRRSHDLVLRQRRVRITEWAELPLQTSTRER